MFTTYQLIDLAHAYDLFRVHAVQLDTRRSFEINVVSLACDFQSTLRTYQSDSWQRQLNKIYAYRTSFNTEYALFISDLIRKNLVDT